MGVSWFGGILCAPLLAGIITANAQKKNTPISTKSKNTTGIFLENILFIILIIHHTISSVKGVWF